MLSHEQPGRNSEDIAPFESEIVGMPVDEYLDWAIKEHAAPDRHPGRLNLDELTVPIIISLASGYSESAEGVSGSDNRTALLEILGTRYAPVADDDPNDGGLMTERSASRAIVGHAVRALYLWARENNLPELSQQATATVCALAEKEMIGGGSLNWWLMDMLRDVVVTQGEAERVSAALNEDLHDSPEWIGATERTRVHDVLLYAMAAHEQLALESSIADFMLKHHGLHPETFLAAWRIGFNEKRTQEANIKDNLLLIAEIEAVQPGICQRLLENNGIRCLIRYSKELLLYLDDFYEPRDRERECASIHTAIFDRKGAFTRPGRYDTLLRQVRGSGRNLAVYEWGSVTEREELEVRARERNPRIVHRLEQAHSDGWTLFYGGVGKERGKEYEESTYSASEMIEDRDRVRAIYDGIARLALNGCNAGAKYGIAHFLSDITDATVMGVSRSKGVSIRYSKTEGFTMTLADGTPAAGLFSASRSRMAEVFRPPRIKSYWNPRTYDQQLQLDEAAHYMSQTDV